MKKFFLCILALLLLFPMAASADTVTFELDIEFSGATAPEGSTPWLEATFDDEDTPGTVLLHLETTNLTGTEFVSEWYFNLNPALNPGSLGFDLVDVGDVSGGSVSLGTDAHQADADGLYDIVFGFGANDFTGGEELVFEFSLAGLTASDFDFYSTDAGGHGPFQSAALVQGIGTDGQLLGWVAPSGEVPEPATMILLGTGLLGLIECRRKLRK